MRELQLGAALRIALSERHSVEIEYSDFALDMGKGAGARLYLGERIFIAP
jgi:hypothetical protein